MEKEEVSLPQAYWGYGLAGNFLIDFATRSMRPPPVWLMLLWGAYNLWVIHLIYGAAERYQGLKLWRYLAIGACVLSGLLVLIMAGFVFTVLARRAESLEPGRSVLLQLFG